MPIKAKFLMISGKKNLTQFMQAADLFEKSKVLGGLEVFTVTFKEEEVKVTFTQCERLIQKMVECFPKEYLLSFLHLHSIIEEDKILLNVNLKCKPYINKSVRTISNGHYYGIFPTILKELGISVETDKHLFIK
jgi:hypothetical protein